MATAIPRPEVLASRTGTLPQAGGQVENGPGRARASSQVGDTVHVSGQGPGVVTLVEEADVVMVHYPDGHRESVGPETVLSRSPSDLVDRNPHVGNTDLVYLQRPFDDTERAMSIPAAVFLLVATMVGGGTLSLPFAMSQCGLIFGTFALLLSAAASAWTINMLIGAARGVGRDSFELLGHAAFKEAGRNIAIGVVGAACWFGMVAYFVLIGDLLTPPLELLLPPLQWLPSEEERQRVVVLLALVLLSPMCFKKKLSEVKELSYLSVSAVLLVGCSLVLRVLRTWGERREVEVVTPAHESASIGLLPQVSLWPASLDAALYAFPMFGLSFLCHFNALCVHTEIARPSSNRLRTVAYTCMAISSILYFTIGFSGYAFAGQYTCGNILLNFGKKDPMATCCRAAFGLVLILNFPLLCQPTRTTLFQLIVACRGKTSPLPAATLAEPGARAAERGLIAEAHCVEAGAAGASVARQAPPSPPQSPQVHVYWRRETRAASAGAEQPAAIDAFVPRDEAALQGAAEPTDLQRIVLTSVLLLGALLTSFCMKSILVVWGLVGSSVAFLMAFILPAAFWLKLEGPRQAPARRRAVAAMLCTSIVLAMLCTFTAFQHLDQPPCPPLPPPALAQDLLFTAPPLTVV